MPEGLFNLEFHNLGVRFIHSAPERLTGQNLPLFPGFCGKHGLPLADPLFPELICPGLFACIRRPYKCGYIVFFHCVTSQLLLF